MNTVNFTPKREQRISELPALFSFPDHSYNPLPSNRYDHLTQFKSDTAQRENLKVSSKFSIDITGNQIKLTDHQKTPKVTVKPTHYVEQANETVDVYTALELIRTDKSLNIYDIRDIIGKLASSLDNVIELLQTKTKALNRTKSDISNHFKESQSTINVYFDECIKSLNAKRESALSKMESIFKENINVVNEMEDKIAQNLNEALVLDKEIKDCPLNVKRVQREIQNLAVEAKNYRRIYVTNLKFDNLNAANLKKYLEMIGDLELDFISVSLEPKEEQDKFYFNTKYCFGNDDLYDEYVWDKRNKEKLTFSADI